MEPQKQCMPGSKEACSAENGRWALGRHNKDTCFPPGAKTGSEMAADCQHEGGDFEWSMLTCYNTRAEQECRQNGKDWSRGESKCCNDGWKATWEGNGLFDKNWLPSEAPTASGEPEWCMPASKEVCQSTPLEGLWAKGRHETYKCYPTGEKTAEESAAECQADGGGFDWSELRCYGGGGYDIGSSPSSSDISDPKLECERNGGQWNYNYAYCEHSNNNAPSPSLRDNRPENDERAKYCGEGTEWRGSDLGCVATAEGAIRACERHRGEQWAFTCRPIDTCDNNHGNRYQNPCKDTSQFTPEMPWGGHCSGDELHDGKGNTKDRCENSLKCNWSSQCTDVGDAGHEDCCHCETPSACEATGAIWEERTCDTPIKEHWDWLFGLTCEQETRYGNAGDILRGWGHQCCANHESICGGVAHDLGWVQEFKCHHDNITGLQADSGQKVMSCERSLCDKNAFAAEGAPTHWYESMCCATCDFSPKDGNWGVSPYDEYLACAQQHCPLGTQWFVNTTTGQAITADTRWGEDADFVFQIMQQHPEATEGVECACRHCGHHLTEEWWPAGPRV